MKFVVTSAIEETKQVLAAEANLYSDSSNLNPEQARSCERKAVRAVKHSSPNSFSR
jgi:hypothetical protein